MADRSWFFASQGQQQGPYPEAQLHQFIAEGQLPRRRWSGPRAWRTGKRPGIFPAFSLGLPGRRPFPGSGVPPMAASAHRGGPLSIEFGIWEFTWRSLVLIFGLLFVIPAPWAILMYCRWIVSRVQVPQRPDLAFTGRAVDLMWVYALVILFIASAWTQSQLLSFAVTVVEFVLYWLLIKWFVANLSSNGQPLGLRFSGSFWGFLGWSLLAVLSIITIVGWAWVYAAQLRWMCRHVDGTRREVVFKGTGLEFLWRGIVTALVSVFIIPLPWAYRWFTRWLVSQVALVERTAQANG